MYNPCNKPTIKRTFFVFVSALFFSHQVCADIYLYQESELQVRAEGDSSSKVIDTIGPGESFEVLKWNTFNSRIRMANGQIGYVERAKLNGVIQKYAPQILDSDTTNNEFLSKPLKLTLTNDEMYLIKRRAVGTLGVFGGNSGNAEFNTNAEGEDLTMPSGVSEDFADQDSGEFDGEPAIEGGRREDFTNMSEDEQDLLSQFGKITWKNAIKKRKMAPHTKKKGYRSGNQSKGWCSRAVRETLVSSGICKEYSGDANVESAVNMHKKGVLKKYCPKLKLSKAATSKAPLTVSDIHNAPGASIIVYSGYAGKKPHKHGHIEIKVPITEELKKSMGKDGVAYQVGEYMYCSDYCRATPTKKSTNTIEAIYTIND